MKQTPNPNSFLLKWRGDAIVITLELPFPRKGRAAFRTNIGNASVRRREIIAETENGVTPLARAWTDLPLEEIKPGVFSAKIFLNEVGVFSGKACFFPEGSNVPEWPEGRNFHIKVISDEARKSNTIYTVFPRQFGSFREVVRRLPTIMDTMGFRIIQTLPPFPVPTTYAVMGEYGCPFAALDFLSVDPALAEFDEYATPLDQFSEFIDAVHARKGLFFVDLPANHTGWASTLQTHHPDWFHRAADKKFISPGAWGVTWADLVELDYSNPELRAYMADVFLFWCRRGVDGFRCDAGYMIPAETWDYIVARVREEYPDTVFMLEGLGGELSVTDRLMAESDLDWAYSEIFQTYDRSAFEWYLPNAIARSEKYGTLVHFAETHDNDRLAKGGEVYARLRVQLAALLSWQGAWGIANGVEWYAREKIDVHGKNDLNWGNKENMIELIARLNFILSTHPSFSGETHLEVITRGTGNTLAVTRSNSLLILANLDCGKSTCIEWDLNRFDATEAFDLLSEEKVDLSHPIKLAPGEVLCLAKDNVINTEENIAQHNSAIKPFVHIVMPRDLKRIVVMPESKWVEVSAKQSFRFRLVDPTTGCTIRVFRSREDGNGKHFVLFDAPHYKGDGSRCRKLDMGVIMYDGVRATRMVSQVVIPPPSKKAKALIAIDGEFIRNAPETRTILSNKAGAASQVRVGWGEIRSQYDAFLAANPNPNCPSDRLTLWTRTRAWLQREGYTRELNRQCVTKFVADPAGRFAHWEFQVPCGMGKLTSFAFDLSLVENKNVAQLKVTRLENELNDVRDQVRLVFRPDIEWRSFHSTTKAYAGAEEKFASSIIPNEKGFIFKPYDKSFKMVIGNGVYHYEPQWDYNISHSEEELRGQDPSGDLFSPGWISADLKIDESVIIEGSLVDNENEELNFAYPQSKLNTTALVDIFGANMPSLSDMLKESLDLYIVKRDNLKTVLAGYPWFLDWGRDTFIFMRGMIAAGKYEDSVKILKAFAAFEEKGTLPNIIYGETAGNRDTTDAQLWFIRCVRELEEVGGIEKEDLTSLRKTCESIVDYYNSGTPNGIHVDKASGLVWSPSHFTWMDTNYPACTPRVGYPVEIQALWISALDYLGREEEALLARKSIERYFRWENGYRDCLAAPNGESVENAIPEDTIRPNQLFLITLGVLKDVSILRATEELLIPGGIRSLNANHALYCPQYSGDEDTSRKPAYHNGTVWAWPFPLYAEAMAIMGICDNETALQILSSCVENFNNGCLCHLSENADGDAPHNQKGCTAQAWSDSEVLRVWLKLSTKRANMI